MQPSKKGFTKITLVVLSLLITSAAIISFSGAQTSPTCSESYAVSPPCAKPACTQTSQYIWHCVCSSGYIYKTFGYGAVADLGIDYDKAVCIPATSPTPSPPPPCLNGQLAPPQCMCGTNPIPITSGYCCNGINTPTGPCTTATTTTCTNNVQTALSCSCGTAGTAQPGQYCCYKNYIYSVNPTGPCPI